MTTTLAAIKAAFDARQSEFAPTRELMLDIKQTKPAYPFDVVIFITRAQPFHYGHMCNVAQALTMGKKVVVIVGSAGAAPDTRNPFTYEQREKMIIDAFDGNPRLSVEPLRDHPYNDTVWASYVQRIVDLYTSGKDMRVGLIGHKKADTTFYLNMFPQWEYIEATNVREELNATLVRKELYAGNFVDYEDWYKRVGFYVAPTVLNQLYYFAFEDCIDHMQFVRMTPIMERLVREYGFLAAHALKWKVAPYAPTFVTVDACVIRSGHVLVIRRRSAPGEGLLALPGGYLEQGERIVDGMVRELYEETRLKVPKEVIRGSIAGKEVYDYPTRSLRGRIITHAFCVKLADGPLPKVKGEDDADKAFWLPITEFYQMQDRFFEDHWYMIDDMISRFAK